ncbi:MDR family MFS transporter [Cryobacterium psychrophilum]|uniref:DHA2 family efflux MFS transporter permease subunit n=1 Tax=Cryobacterium psychrophilum TaxID=41988 RepID=A0A4Y8KKX2_9MICO|nr:MDR family MFS transporter [Cryobacterium psychrophilum]TDW30243.1 DHA2 family lincomycin resistance protein-like MFS transporter [Cryobacterium psychrophilum]TFD77466.1 DHA2 family efflux MFS transporter permease subunit [Cryobacterium psychrophilum]
MTERTLSQPPATADAAPIADDSKRNRLVIGILLTSAFIVILNETIMGVALPHLMTDLSITASTAQWLTTAFMLTMAVVIPITGFLLQRFHTRPVFIAAMSLFSLGTLIAAIAPGFEVLLVGRVVQASGTAIMLPLLMTTVMMLVEPASRGKTMGNISIVISVAPAIGPTISGVILSVLDWRWMFILVLPIAVGALLFGAGRIQNVTTPRTVPIDTLSIILSAFGFGGLIYGLSNLGSTGESGAYVGVISLVIGALALVAFVLRQVSLQRSDRALLDLRTFRSSTFTIAIVMLGLSMIALFGTLILLPIYMQTVLGLDALSTGLLLLPGGITMGVLAPFVGRVYDRFGPTVLLVPGSIFVSAALWSMTLMGASTAPSLLMAAHIALSAGLALIFTPLFTSSLASLTPELYSHGSAVVGTVQQLAAAIGTALFIAVLSAQSAGLIADGASEATATAAGVHAAFVYGAVISVFAIPLAFLVGRARLSTQPLG